MHIRASTFWAWLATWGPPIAGGAAFVAIVPRADAFPVPFLAGFIALGVLGSWAIMPFSLGGTLTLASAAALPALLVVGPLPAAVAGATGEAIYGLLKRHSLDRITFNAGQRVVAVVLAGVAWSSLLARHPAMGGTLLSAADDPAGGYFPAGVGGILVYALTTTLLVSARIATTRNRPFRSILLQNAPWQLGGHAAIGTAGVMVVLFASGHLSSPDIMGFGLLQIAAFVALLYLSRIQVSRESADLHDALTDLLRTLNTEEVLDRFAAHVQRLADPAVMWVAVRGTNTPYEIPLVRGIDREALEPLAPAFEGGATAWVLEHLSPLRLHDYTRYPERNPVVDRVFGRGWARSTLIVPLVVGREWVGVVTLLKPVPGYFTAYHERMVATLAAQAALALNNARLYGASRRSLSRVEALQHVARAASAGSDFTEIQQKILDIAVATLGADRGVLALYDEQELVLRAAAFNNLSPEQGAARVVSLEDGWQYYAPVQSIRTMQPVAVTDRTMLPGAPPVLPPDKSRSVLAVPMTVQGRVVGTISVGHTDRHEWTEEEIELLQALGSESAVAIENARLSKSTNEQLQRMNALETISERINSLNDINAVFALIADSTREVLGADRCSIILGGPGAGATHVFSPGVPDKWVRIAAENMKAGVGPTSLAMRLREPVILTDVLTDPRAGAFRESGIELGYRTVALFPLIYRSQVVGILRLFHDAVRRYEPADIALGAAFANQAAIAVQNTRLLQEAERRAHQLDLLNRMVTRVVTTLRPEDLFETLVEELHTTLGYPFVSIFLVKGDRLRMAAYRGYLEHLSIPQELTLTEGVIGRTARTRQPVLVERVQADPEYVAVVPHVTQEACVPIFQDGRLAGVINVEVVDPTLTHADLDLLTTLASEVTSAMRNATLFAEVHQAHDELQALYESAQALSSSLELSTVLEAMVSVTCRQFGYDRGAILLVDAAGDLLVHATYGEPAPAGRIPLGSGTEGRAAHEARPVLVADVTAGLAHAVGPDPTPAGPALAPGATLAVPLLREGRVIGVFSVGSARPGSLGDRDQRILTTLAGYAAVAIENARLYEQARHLAVTDGLTGLLNHRAFHQTFDQELERSKRYALPLALIMIEIDKFKRYNDTYGHLRGDEVLRLVARILDKEHRQQVDIVARYGGDEFMLLLPHTSKAAAADVAERIRRTVEVTPFIVGTAITTVTLSLGVAALPDDGDTTDALLDTADRRMYAAKHAGGNAVATTTA